MRLLLLGSILLLSNAICAEINIKQLKSSALKNSFSLKSIESDLNASQENIKINKSKFYPKAGVELGQELTLGNGKTDRENILAVYGEMNVFNGYKDSLNLTKSKNEKERIRIKLERQKHISEVKVESLYYEYLYLLEKKKILTLANKRNSKHISMVRKRFNAGMVTQTDLLEFKLKKSNLDAQSEMISLDILRAKEKLLNFSGLDLLNEYHIVGELPHLHILTNYNEVLTLSDMNNTLLKYKALEKNNYEILRKINNSKKYPSVDLKAKYGMLSEQETGVSNEQRVGQVSLIATWEAFSGGQRQAKEGLLNHQLNSLNFELKQLNRELRNKIKNDFDKIKILEKQIDSIEENQKIALKLYKKTLREYTKGVKDSGALVNASDLYKELSEKVFETKLSHLLTKLDLERFIGSNLNFERINH